MCCIAYDRPRMKITLAYLETERKSAAAVLAALLRLFPTANIRESDRHPPYKHMYVTTRKPAPPCGTNENT